MKLVRSSNTGEYIARWYWTDKDNAARFDDKEAWALKCFLDDTCVACEVIDYAEEEDAV